MDSSLRYKDKVVVITGGASGIGKGSVEVFVRHGSKVVFCDVNDADSKILEKELNKNGPGEAYYIHCDLFKEAEIKDMIGKVVEKYGTIDCLINNAGEHPPRQTIDHFTADGFTKTLQLNVIAYFLTCKYALPYIRVSKGNIINIASLVAQIGQKEAVTYAATKGAVTSMSKAMAIDEALHGVRVNVISPGCIWTPMFEKEVYASKNPEQFLKDVKASQPLGCLGEPSNVGMACLFLATDATFCTGIDLNISGGAEINYGIKCELVSS